MMKHDINNNCLEMDHGEDFNSSQAQNDSNSYQQYQGTLKKIKNAEKNPSQKYSVKCLIESIQEFEQYWFIRNSAHNHYNIFHYLCYASVSSEQEAGQLKDFFDELIKKCPKEDLFDLLYSQKDYRAISNNKGFTHVWTTPLKLSTMKSAHYYTSLIIGSFFNYYLPVHQPRNLEKLKRMADLSSANPHDFKTKHFLRGSQLETFKQQRKITGYLLIYEILRNIHLFIKNTKNLESVVRLVTKLINENCVAAQITEETLIYDEKQHLPILPLILKLIFDNENIKDKKNEFKLLKDTFTAIEPEKLIEYNKTFIPTRSFEQKKQQRSPGPNLGKAGDDIITFAAFHCPVPKNQAEEFFTLLFKLLKPTVEQLCNNPFNIMYKIFCNPKNWCIGILDAIIALEEAKQIILQTNAANHYLTLPFKNSITNSNDNTDSTPTKGLGYSIAGHNSQVIAELLTKIVSFAPEICQQVIFQGKGLLQLMLENHEPSNWRHHLSEYDVLLKRILTHAHPEDIIAMQPVAQRKNLNLIKLKEYADREQSDTDTDIDYVENEGHDGLECEHQDWEQKYDALWKEYQGTLHDYQQVAKANEKRKRKFENVCEESTRKQQQLENFKKEKVDLTKQIKELVEQKKTDAEKLQQAITKYAQEQEKNLKLEQDLTDERTAKKDLTETCDDLTDQLAKKEERVTQLQTEKSEAENDLKEEQRENSSLKRKNEALNTADQQLKALQESHLKLKTKFEEKKRQYQTKVTEVINMQSELSKKQKTITEVQIEKEQLVNDNRQLKQEKSDLLNDKNNLTQQNQKLQSKIDALQPLIQSVNVYNQVGTSNNNQIAATNRFGLYGHSQESNDSHQEPNRNDNMPESLASEDLLSDTELENQKKKLTEFNDSDSNINIGTAVKAKEFFSFELMPEACGKALFADYQQQKQADIKPIEMLTTADGTAQLCDYQTASVDPNKIKGLWGESTVFYFLKQKYEHKYGFDGERSVSFQPIQNAPTVIRLNGTKKWQACNYNLTIDIEFANKDVFENNYDKTAIEGLKEHRSFDIKIIKRLPENDAKTLGWEQPIKKKYIEVKATKKSSTNLNNLPEARITKCEWKHLDKYNDVYRMFRIYKAGEKDAQLKIVKNLKSKINERTIVDAIIVKV